MILVDLKKSIEKLVPALFVSLCQESTRHKTIGVEKCCLLCFFDRLKFPPKKINYANTFELMIIIKLCISAI